QLVAETPLAVDLVVRVVALAARVLEVTAARLLRGGTDHADGRFFPLVLEDVPVHLSVERSPLVAGGVAPLTADGRPFLDHVKVAVDRAVIDARPLATLRHVAGLRDRVHVLFLRAPTGGERADRQSKRSNQTQACERSRNDHGRDLTTGHPPEMRSKT